MKKAKPVIIFLLKLLVSGGLLAYFLSRVHPERFLHTFASANYSWIALALTVYLVAQAISAVRWTVLARPLGIATPFKDLVKYYLIGMFFNLFAPGTVGGDVSRVYYLVRDEAVHAKGRAVPTMHAAMSVLMDRAIGMVVLVWLGATGLLLFPQYAVPRTVRMVTFVLASGFVVAVLLAPLLRRLLPEDGHPIVVKVRLLFRSYRMQWRALVAAGVAVDRDTPDSGLDACGDGARAGFGVAVHVLSHRLSIGRNFCRDSREPERARAPRRGLHLSARRDRHRHGERDRFRSVAVSRSSRWTA